MANLQAMLSTLLDIGKRYYCHQCESPFRSRPAVTDPLCPHCGSEFVEAIGGDERQDPGAWGQQEGQEPLITYAPPGGYDPYEGLGLPDNPDRPRYRVPEGEPLISLRIPRPRPLGVQIHEHLDRLMSGSVRERDTAHPQGTTNEQSSQETGQTTQQTGQSSQETSQTQPDGQEASKETSQASQETGQAINETGQASNETNQASKETGPSTTDHSSVSPPPARRHRPDPSSRLNLLLGSGGGGNLADLHFSVGMPWYFMLHHRDRARREQPPPPPSQGRAQFGRPTFMGFGGTSGGVMHGSPADYVWGAQGVDDIITRMLASLEDPGPPPADKEKIDSLPTVLSTPENMKNCSECSVCKEVFAVSESLLQLPCLHLYHKDCVLPWLKLHDTCPTCRFHLNTGKPDERKGPV